MQAERMTTVDDSGFRRRRPRPMASGGAQMRRMNCKPPGTAGNRHFQRADADFTSSPARNLKKHLLDEPATHTQPKSQPPGSTGSPGSSAAPAPVKWALFAHADRTDYVLMTVGLLAAFVSGSSLPVINIVFANAVTALSNPKFPPHNVDVDGIVGIFWALVGIAIWILVSEFLCIALLTHSAARQTRVMREAVMEALVYQDMAWYDVANPYSLSSDIGSTMVVIQDGLGRKLGQFVKFSTQVVLAMSVGIQRGWNVGLLIAALFPVFLIAIFVFVKYVAQSTNMETDEYSNAAAVAEEALTSVTTVMSFNAQTTVLGRFKAFLYSGESVYRKLSRVIAVAVAVIQFLSFVLYGYGLWIGGRIVAGNDTVVPTMAKALPAIFVEITGLLAIGMAAPAMEALAGAQAAASYIIEIEKQRSGIDCRSDQGARLDDRGFDGSISFKDVVFAYPTRPRDLVLKTCSFTIAAGQRVALVGPSGSGKSTIISLLERLYDPAFGRISIDGHDLQSLQLRWLRTQFGVVRQEPVLFATSIMENVRYGRASATDEEVIAACRLAHAHGFISALPDGYATQIGANGSFLSTGQRQRLAIARAVVRKPRILLLDEATVALDPTSGDTVQRAFDELVERESVTTLVIAHRLATIQRADVVFVMEDGRITEEGSYTDLSQDPTSRYCALFGCSGDAMDEQDRLTQVTLLQSSRYMARRRPRPSQYQDRQTGLGLLGSFFQASAYQNDQLADSHHVENSSRRHRDMDRMKSPAIMGAPSDARPSDIALLESFRSSVGYSVGLKSTRLSTINSQEAKKQHDKARLSSHTNSTANGSSSGAFAIQKTDAQQPQKSVFQKILALASEDRRFMILAMITSLFNGIASPITVVLRADMIQDLYRIEALKDNVGLKAAADKYFMLFLGVGIAIAISSFTQSFNFRLLGRNLTNRMRSLAFQSMLRQDMKWFDAPGHSAGALSGMLANDTAAVKIIAGEIQGRKTQNLVVIFISFVLSCIIGSWQVAAVFLGIVLVIVFAIVVDQRITWYAEEHGDRTLASSGRIANEIIHNVQTITENNLQETILAEFRASLDLPTRVAIRTGYSSGFAIAFSQSVKWIGYGVLNYTGALFIESGATNFKNFYRSFNLANVSAMCIDETALFVSDEKAATTAAERIFELMENKPDVDVDAPNGVKLDDDDSNGGSGRAGLEVRVEDVAFAYPTVPDSRVLDHFSMHVPATKVTALMGGSDGGKSTLLQLLTRLYDTDAGAIFIGDVPIQRLDVRWLRSRVAIVHQEPVLLRMSVFDNVRLGKPQASMGAVQRACEAADAHGFISELPECYETIVDSDKFSRGEKQRLAIARALLLEPRVLLLDEATSALDQECCNRVTESLLTLAKEKRMTVLAVTQQDSLVEEAAQVVVAAEGSAMVETRAGPSVPFALPSQPTGMKGSSRGGGGFSASVATSNQTGPTTLMSSFASSSTSANWI